MFIKSVSLTQRIYLFITFKNVIYWQFKVTSKRPLFCVYIVSEVRTPVMLHERSNEACDWKSDYTEQNMKPT